MPLTKMTCPHCEEEIQVPVASVTRLRVCPACGETVLLNLSGGVQKRAALLVQSEAILEPVAVALPYLPKPLTEEEINLQRRDPESRRLLLKLVVGMVSVILLVGLMVLLEGDEGSELAVVEPRVPEALEVKVEVAPVEEVKVEPVKEVVASRGQGGFEVLFRERPKRPVELRVWAKEGSVFGGVFGDSEWLRCVELRAADDPNGRVLRAYVVRTSETGGAVDFRLRQGGSEAQRWIVRVRYPAEAEEPNQVWLDEVVADGWELPSS